MIRNEGMMDLSLVDLKTLHSICQDVVNSDTNVFKKNGKVKLRYAGLVKNLNELSIPLQKLLVSKSSEMDLENIIKKFDKIMEKISDLRPTISIQRIHKGNKSYLSVEETEMRRSTGDLREVYGIVKQNERREMIEKAENEKAAEERRKPRERAERMAKAKEGTEGRRDKKEFLTWLEESAKAEGIQGREAKEWGQKMVATKEDSGREPGED